MEQTLNSRIYKILEDCEEVDYCEDGGYDFFNKTQAAESIERLMLREKLDLLRNLNTDIVLNGVARVPKKLETLIELYTKQLNELQ